MLRATVRKILYRITGINSIGQAINPMTYLDALCFHIVYLRTKGQVMAGKFEGMCLEKVRNGSELKPKLLGTYESELDESVRKYFLHATTIIDIGSDDGYYAIGLVGMNSNAKVIAVECAPNRCELIQRNATRNLVGERLTVVCCKLEEGDELLQLLSNLPAPIVIKCDIEGGEYKLFNKSTLAILHQKGIPIIVETHINEQYEMQLIEDMRICGYNVNGVNKKQKKVINIYGVDRLSVFMCHIFARRWTNEGRGAQFNRWLVACLML